MDDKKPLNEEQLIDRFTHQVSRRIESKALDSGMADGMVMEHLDIVRDHYARGKTVYDTANAIWKAEQDR